MTRREKVLYAEVKVSVRVPDDQADADRSEQHMEVVVERLSTFLASQMLPGWEYSLSRTCF